MIVVTQKGTLTPKNRELLNEKGYIVIECDNPDKVKIINPEMRLETNDLLMSALHAMRSSNPTCKQEYFVNDLYNRLSKK